MSTERRLEKLKVVVEAVKEEEEIEVIEKNLEEIEDIIQVSIKVFMKIARISIMMIPERLKTGSTT